MKLLIVDDEENICNLIEKYAKFEGYEVVKASNGLEAVEISRQDNIDLIIMDIMMPQLDGFSTCKEIRRNKNTPIIMLSARGEEIDKVYGFESGIDDYVVKPFSPKELMLRVNAVLKRASLKSVDKTEHEVFEIEGLYIDFTSRKVTVDGTEVVLSPKEYDLLFYMVRNRDIALSREKMINAVWGYDFYGDDRTLDTHIKMLRKSLGRYNVFIATVRGVGYRFEKN